MKLKKIQLKNFRNYETLELEFSKNIICFTGLNGQGKTNIAEAVSVLGLLSSFRTVSYSEMIKFGESGFYISGEFVNNSGRDIEVVISFDGKIKKIMYQNKRITRFSEMWGKIPIVYLIPDESLITTGPPASRRDFFDRMISLTDADYLHLLNEYISVIKQKNKVLSEIKEGRPQAAELIGIYNSKIAADGNGIFEKRTEFIKKFLPYFTEILEFISDGLYSGGINYETIMDMHDYGTSLTGLLKEQKDQEIRRGVSVIGPHKDDFDFLINGRSLRKYGSKGQHKIFLVALKLAGTEYIKSITDEYPIFVLDDLYSEIDEFKSLKVAKILDKDIQTFITTSNSRIIDQLDKKVSQLFSVENGKCTAVF
ncbi:MAG: DNA replication and repair protein RecF [Candidatus Delongbacteria bacterium]